MSDGNGMVRVSRRPVVGVPRVTKFMTAIASWFWEGVDLRWTSTNGQTSVVIRHGGDVRCVLTVTATTDGIDRVLWMFNPDKIGAVSA